MRGASAGRPRWHDRTSIARECMVNFAAQPCTRRRRMKWWRGVVVVVSIGASARRFRKRYDRTGTRRTDGAIQTVRGDGEQRSSLAARRVKEGARCSLPLDPPHSPRESNRAAGDSASAFDCLHTISANRLLQDDGSGGSLHQFSSASGGGLPARGAGVAPTNIRRGPALQSRTLAEDPSTTRNAQ
jgi:hypothetical protein